MQLDLCSIVSKQKTSKCLYLNATSNIKNEPGLKLTTKIPNRN